MEGCKMTISACLIVRNGAETLEQTLGSIRPYVDEVNIYDTGSTDGTFELLEKVASDEGAPLRVERGEWRDHFGWAYEQSFAMASSEMNWLLWLDQDDELRGGEHLPAIVEAADAMVDGFEFKYDYLTDFAGVLDWWRPSLLRRDRGWCWPGAIHELPEREDGLEPNYVPVPAQKMSFLHLRQEVAQFERNGGLLHRRIEKAERSGQPALFDDLGFLGAEYLAHGEPMRAVYWLTRALDFSEWSKNGLYFAKCLAVAHQWTGRPDAASALGQEIVQRYPDWADSPHGLVAITAAQGDFDLLQKLQRDHSTRQTNGERCTASRTGSTTSTRMNSSAITPNRPASATPTAPRS
jgi:hypothetical protein